MKIRLSCMWATRSRRARDFAMKRWCGPCQMVAPEIRKVATETAGQFLVVKVNTEELPSLARRFRVTAIPTMSIFRNGIEVAHRAGAMAAPAIRKFLEQDLVAR